MTLRLATPSDIARIVEIGGGRENRLTGPAAIAAADARRLIAERALWLWQDADGVVAGFAGASLQDGSLWALFVAAGQEGRGIGRALLKATCDALRGCGHHAATLSIAPGSRAERHFRADGWHAIGTNATGDVTYQKPL